MRARLLACCTVGLGLGWTASAAAQTAGPTGAIGAVGGDVSTLTRRADSAAAAGRVDEARRAYLAAATRVDPSVPDSLRRRLYHRAGRMEIASGHPRAAIPWLLRAAAPGPGAASRIRALALMDLTAAALASDALDIAARSVDSAIAIVEARHDTMRAAIAWNSSGMVRRALGYPDAAAKAFDRALLLARAIRDSRTESTTLNNIGLMADEEARDARGPAAVAAADRAITVYRASLTLLDPRDAADIAQTYNNLGVSYRRRFLVGADRAALDSADAYYGRAGNLFTWLNDTLALARLEHNRALVRRDRGDLQEARAGLDRALAALQRQQDRWWEAMTLRELADTYRGGTLSDRSLALAHYDSAARVFAQISANTGADANRAAYADQKAMMSLFESWALAALGTRAAGGGAEGQAACAAFAAAERGRAQALIALLGAATPGDSAGAGRGQVGHAPAALATSTTTDSHCPAAGRAMLTYFATADTLLIWVTDGRAPLHVEAVPVGRDSVTTLVAQARRALGIDPPDEASPDAGTGRVAAVPSAGTVRAGGTRGAGRTGSERRARQALDALRAALLPPAVAARLPRAGGLLVIPHGVISLVPFAALPLTAADTAPLGAALALTYAPALAVATAVEQRPARTVPLGDSSAVLVVGNPLMPPAVDERGRPIELKSLPGARAEAVAVAKRFRVRPLTDDAATEPVVRARWGTARLIHLATHGIAYATDARAAESFVALAPESAGGSNGTSPSHDGHLTVGELLGDPALALAAELVVLSACETALGRLRQSEGTLGLQRALLARGARSVIVTLWSVDDGAARMMMERFYEHWESRQHSKAEALRLAQRQVRIRYPRAKDWAAFQLVGAS